MKRRVDIPEAPFRWTVNKVVSELHITSNKFRSGCALHGIEPGQDNKYSSQDVFRALTISGTEAKAREARWKHQIAESEYAQTKLLEQKHQLIPRQDVEEYITDVMIRLVQNIRHSNLSEQDKRRAIMEIKSIEFKDGKIVPLAA